VSRSTSCPGRRCRNPVCAVAFDVVFLVSRGSLSAATGVASNMKCATFSAADTNHWSPASASTAPRAISRWRHPAGTDRRCGLFRSSIAWYIPK
jgi:hypothetical protein